MITEKREKSLKRSADDILLYDGPGDLVHRTDLHADALQGVVITLPMVPCRSNTRESCISPPKINPVEVCGQTTPVPERSHVSFGTVYPPPGILVFVKGGEFSSVVITQGVSYRNTYKNHTVGKFISTLNISLTFKNYVDSSDGLQEQL